LSKQVGETVNHKDLHNLHKDGIQILGKMISVVVIITIGSKEDIFERPTRWHL